MNTVPSIFFFLIKISGIL